MIDLHTHIWDVDKHLSASFQTLMGGSFKATPAATSQCAPADPARHWQACQAADKTVVLAFDMGHCGAVVPNEYVANYVQQHPERLVGFASVDPNREDALARLAYAHQTLGLKGLKMSGTYQNVHPHDKRVYALYHYCEQHGLPILLHHGATIFPQAPLAYAQPLLLEQVAHDFPALNIIIAHMGFPWTVDAITVMRKHHNVFADISALCYRPWQLYNALLTAIEATVTERLFFGTDWPFTTIEQTLKALEQLPEMGKNCHLPTVPKAFIDELIHKDSLAQLGIV